VQTESGSRAAALLLTFAVLGGAGCSRAEHLASRSETPSPSTPAAAPAEDGASAKTLCEPSTQGYLRARLQGSINAELDWSGDVPQCLGATRPGGDGVRLLFKGPAVADEQGLLIVIGAGPLRAGESRRQVPANITLVREGSGEFFATQGDDKCALDEVIQHALEPERHRFRLTARGYCTQPARSVRGDGAVLVSRFDVESVVDFSDTAAPPTLAGGTR
jgi:hypothetical protein